MSVCSIPPPPFSKVLCYRPEKTGGTWGINSRNSYPSFFTLPPLNCLFHISFAGKCFFECALGGGFIWNLGSQQRFLFVWSTTSWMSVEITSWLASWKLSSLTDWFGPLCKHPCLLSVFRRPSENTAQWPWIANFIWLNVFWLAWPHQNKKCACLNYCIGS